MNQVPLLFQHLEDLWILLMKLQIQSSAKILIDFSHLTFKVCNSIPLIFSVVLLVCHGNKSQILGKFLLCVGSKILLTAVGFSGVLIATFQEVHQTGFDMHRWWPKQLIFVHRMQHHSLMLLVNSKSWWIYVLPLLMHVLFVFVRVRVLFLFLDFNVRATENIVLIFGFLLGFNCLRRLFIVVWSMLWLFFVLIICSNFFLLVGFRVEHKFLLGFYARDFS